MSCDGSLFVFCFKDMLVNLLSVELQAWKRCILWLDVRVDVPTVESVSRFVSQV